MEELDIALSKNFDMPCKFAEEFLPRSIRWSLCIWTPLMSAAFVGLGLERHKMVPEEGVEPTRY